MERLLAEITANQERLDTQMGSFTSQMNINRKSESRPRKYGGSKKERQRRDRGHCKCHPGEKEVKVDSIRSEREEMKVTVSSIQEKMEVKADPTRSGRKEIDVIVGAIQEEMEVKADSTRSGRKEIEVTVSAIQEKMEVSGGLHPTGVGRDNQQTGGGRPGVCRSTNPGLAQWTQREH
jgi:hypothetical protein